MTGRKQSIERNISTENRERNKIEYKWEERKLKKKNRK